MANTSEEKKKTLGVANTSEEKKKALDAAIAKLEKDFGKGAVMKLGESGAHVNVETVPTGCLSLDLALGLGGVPKGRAIDIIVIDSVAALVPKQEIEGDMGDSHVGLQARLMSQALRKLTPVISKSNCIVIFINQLREKVGVMFGSPETTTGGRALKFYASVRMDVRRIETLKQSGEMVGNRTRIKIVKNKIAPPFKEAEFDIMFGKGVSKSGDILDLASGIDVVKKSGSWYAYEGEKIGQGRENAKSYLESQPEMMDEIEQKVRAHYHLGEEYREKESADDLKLTAKADSKSADKSSDKADAQNGKTADKTEQA